MAFIYFCAPSQASLFSAEFKSVVNKSSLSKKCFASKSSKAIGANTVKFATIQHVKPLNLWRFNSDTNEHHYLLPEQVFQNSGPGSPGNFPPNNTRRYDDGNDDDSSMPPQFSEMAALVSVIQRRYRPYQSRRQQQWPSTWEEFSRSIRISHILLALNALVFVIQTFSGPEMLMAGAKVNSAIAAGEYYRLVSPMFLHGSITHLMVNSFSLHSTGPSVESWFGKKRFLSLYLASGVAGNLLSYAFTPTPSVGASGAIFGLVGATVVILGRHRKMLGPRAKRGLQSLAYIVLMNFGMGMTPGSRVDNFGHLGGLLGGIAFSYLAGPRLVARRTTSGKYVIRDEPILRTSLHEMRTRLRNVRKAIFSR